MSSVSDSSGTKHAAEDLTPASLIQLVSRAEQLQSAKQLSVCSDDNRGEAHRNCADAHGKVEPPVDEKACGDRCGSPKLPQGRKSGPRNNVTNPLHMLFISNAFCILARDRDKVKDWLKLAQTAIHRDHDSRHEAATIRIDWRGIRRR